MSSKWEQLVETLIRLSSNGKLDWQETSDPEIFQTRVGSRLLQLEWSSIFETFTLKILGAHGGVVDSFDADDIVNLGGKNWSPEVENLVVLIKRNISGAEAELDAVLDALSEKEDPPF